MKQKRVSLILLVLLLSIIILVSVLPAVRAETTEEQKVAKAFEWLNKEASENWNTMDTKQNVFTLLALQCNSSAYSKANASLFSKSFYAQGQRCFGSQKITSLDQCTMTETAMAKLALDEVGQNTTAIDKWILKQNKTFMDIFWYLQLDIEQGQRANCSIIYNGQEETGYKIFENKTVQGSGDCFTAAGFPDTNEKYWFQVKKDENCYNNEYTIKCWSGSTYYTSSWFYKKSPTSNIYYISGETLTGRPGYGTVEPDPIDTSLTSYCFKSPGISSTACNYEGTGWALYALKQAGNSEEANKYLPYLVMMQDENVKYFPETFLYQLMGTSVYETKIKNQQKSSGYWLIQPIEYGRNYDTAHASLSLGLGNEAVDKAKEWLLSSQTSSGYWDTADPKKDILRDTAFILWVFWPDKCGQGAGGGCEAQGDEFSCKTDCDANEIIINYLDCPLSDICCKKIGFGEEDCVGMSGECKNSCTSDEFELAGGNCSSTDICCKSYSMADCSEAGGQFCGSLMCSGTKVWTVDSILEQCCLGECIGSQSCAQQNGEICEPGQGKYCPASNLLAANDTDYCCESGECKDASQLSCSELSGEKCINEEVCLDSFGNVIDFLDAQDGECCVDGTCGVDDYCANVGAECTGNEECWQNVFVKTKDADECCTSGCLTSCTDQGGELCSGSEQCSGGSMFKSSENGPDVNRCCVGGNCKAKGGFPLWVIIIIVILGCGVAAYFLFFKKARKPKVKPASQFPFMTPGMIRPSFPTARPSQPLARKPVVMPSVPRPQQKMPSGAPTSIMRKLVQQPSVRMPARKINAARRFKPKARKTGKGEAELEKTLSKLRAITKKK